MSDAIADPTEDTPASMPSAETAPPSVDETSASNAAEPRAEEGQGNPDDGPAEAPAEPIDAAAIEDAPQEQTVGFLTADDAAAPATAATATAGSPVAVAVAASRRRERVYLRPVLTLGLFAIGIIAGALIWRAVTVVPSAVEAFPALPTTGEPPIAAVVAQHLAANDAQALSESLEQDVLDAIRAQVAPLTALERVTFVNAAALDDQILVAYVVEGTDTSGARGIVGLIMVVRDGAVVAQ